MRHSGSFGFALALAAVLLCAPRVAAAVDFNVVGLVSDDPAAQAKVTDADLINAWGMASSPSGPFWISANGTNKALVYSVSSDPGQHNATSKIGLTVTVPGSGLTGQAFSPGTGFDGDRFLFVGEDGGFYGWRGALGTTAEVRVTPGLAVYKGLGYANVGGHDYAYAADFQNGKVTVFKGDTAAPDLAGNFTDPNLPAGFAPFNVQALGGSLYVAYAKQSGGIDEQAGPGLGIVDRFDVQGNLVARIAGSGSGSPLNAPWGLAIAPSSFGAMAGALLVGNFGDGRISAYDIATRTLLGQVSAAGGAPLVIDGLWAIGAGNGGSGGQSALLYFTAGPGDEAHGLFGVLTPVPEPGAWALLAAGLPLLLSLRRRRG